MATDIGIESGVLADGYDLSSVLTGVQVADPMDALDSTKLRNPSRTRGFTAGLVGGAVQTTALPDISESLVNIRLRRGLGAARSSGQELMICGANVGDFALFFKSLQTTWRIDPVAAGLISAAADFQVTSGVSGKAYGVLLQTPFGSANINISELVRLSGTNASGSAVIALSATPLGAGGNVTVTQGMTVSALQTAIRALAGYNDAGVVVGNTGVIASGGLNEVQTISSAVAVVLTAQGTGTTQTITPGTDNLAAIQTKLAAAKGITNGDIVATGTSVAAAGGTPTSYVISSAGDASYNGTYADLGGLSAGNKVYQLGTGGTARYLTWHVSNLFWCLSTGPDAGASGYAYKSPTGGSAATVVLTGWTVNAGTAPAPTLAVGATTGGTAASLAISATFSGASVTKTAQTLFATATGGVTIARTQTGTPDIFNGAYDITLGGALNGVNISPISLTSGTGYSITTLQDGGVGQNYNLVSASGAGAMVTDIAFNQTTNNGALIEVQTIQTGTSANYTVQHSVDNGSGQATTWVDLVAISTISTVGAVRASVAAGTTIQSHVRVNITAISGSFISAVAFARR